MPLVRPTYQRSAAATNLDPVPRPGPFLEQGMNKGPSDSAGTKAATHLSADSPQRLLAGEGAFSLRQDGFLANAQAKSVIPGTVARARDCPR